jgi:hypothetical protein
MIEVQREPLALSFLESYPVWQSGGSQNRIERYDAYTHTINAIGGYSTASLTLGTSRDRAEDYYLYGLGRDIKAYGPNLEEIFNGFINKIRVQIGTLSAEIGPLLNIANDVKLYHVTADTSTNPPIVGVRRSTGSATDTDSQERYGTLQKVLSVDRATDATATQIRDTYLEENKDPETNNTITIGQSAAATVTLEIQGYVNLLATTIYNTTTTGTRTYSLRIQDAVAAAGIFSADYSNIASNASTVLYYDNENRNSWQIIKDILAKGSAANDRWIFGIYAGRKAYYNAIPTSIEYLHRINDNKQRITNIQTGVEVWPWNVLPGRWIMLADWLMGQKIMTSSLRDDLRNRFIESVTYTAPWGLQINGAKVSTLPQLLARLGLSGIGA